MSSRLASVVLLVFAAPGAAQCPPAWLGAHDGPALNGPVRAIVEWDPDGPGPRPVLPVVGGAFSLAGQTQVRNLAAWTESGWQPVGGGTSGGQLLGQVSALAVLPSGDLVAAGLFTTAGSTGAANIARFDGTAWHALGDGLTGQSGATLGGVRALLVLPDGDLIAGGDFTASGATPLVRIARWDGAAWTALGGGMTRQSGQVYAPAVFALALDSGGDIIAGGQWSHAGGVPSQHIARWSGGQWLPMGVGFNAYVTALVALPGGEAIAGGEFNLAGATPVLRVARWTGGAWTAMGTGFDATVRGLTLDPGGAPIAAGFFIKSGSPTVNRVARWNGAAWAPLSTGTNGTALAAATLSSGEVAVGGAFSTAGSVTTNGLARWTTEQDPWIALHPEPAAAPCGGQASLVVAPAPGFTGLGYQWRRDGVPIDPSEVPSATTPTLVIAPVTPAGAGEYDCIVSGPCEEAVSHAATLTVSGPCCPADFDENGFVNGDDFDAFSAAFEAGELSADFNGDTFVTGEDFDGYAAAFGGGC